MNRPDLHTLLFTLLSLVFISDLSFSQDSTEIPSRIQIVSVYVLPGFTSFSSRNTSLNDFRALAPNSEILNQDFSQFNNWQNNFYSGSSSGSGLGTFAPALGIRFNRKDGTVNNHFIMRAGLTYSNGELLYQGNFKSIRIPYDTLVSISTGETVILDSIHDRALSMSYAGSSLQIDLALMWSTDFEARFQVYGGVGIAAGLSFNNNTTISDNEFIHGPEGNRYDQDGTKFNIESFHNESGFVGNVYLPLGLDWRLGKQGFWQSIHLVCEFRPALAFNSIPELDSYVAPSFGFLTGIKVGW